MLLAMARTSFRVLVFVALLSLGMAFISPNLEALISKRGGQEVGTALGIQNNCFAKNNKCAGLVKAPIC